VKKFNTLIIDDQEYKGIGYYKKTSNRLLIEAEDHSITTLFRSFIRDKKIVPLIQIKGEESDGIFRGNYLVVNIRNNVIELVKTK